MYHELYKINESLSEVIIKNEIKNKNFYSIEKLYFLFSIVKVSNIS